MPINLHSIGTTLSQLCKTATAGGGTLGTPGRQRSGQAQLEVEALEQRLVPASIARVGSLLTFSARAGEMNNVTVFSRNNAFVFTDTAAPINITAGELVFTRISPNEVSIPAALFRRAEVRLGDMWDRITIGGSLLIGVAAPSFLIDGGSGPDEITVNSSLVNRRSSHRFTIEGGADADLLRYDAAAPGVVVNLAAGTASGISGGISSIENVWGGGGNDVLIGDGNRNILVGFDGNDALVGGDGNDDLWGGGGRDLLIGGTGSDQLAGGVHDDILIDGTTSHDGNVDALRSILTEWGRTDRTVLQRIANLRNGGADAMNRGFLINSSSVMHDWVQDIVVGDLGTDWFWAIDPDITDWFFEPVR